MQKLTELIREDMKPALGVTEPGAIAFAVASAKKYTEGKIVNVHYRKCSCGIEFRYVQECIYLWNS